MSFLIILMLSACMCITSSLSVMIITDRCNC